MDIKKKIDAIRANIDEILDYFGNEEDENRFTYCAMLSDTIKREAEQIGGFCRTMAIAQEVERNKQG